MVDLHDDEGHRYGDWQKRNLRKDANDLIEDVHEKPWYQQNFWLVVILLAFWPAGLYLCWKSNWPFLAKIVATLLIVCLVAAMLVVYTQKNGWSF